MDGAELEAVLRSALMSPTSKGRKEWQFVAIDDKATIDKLADCKEHGSHFIRHAPVVVTVCGRPAADDCWIEDCAIAAVTMQYQAEELGLATCWVQVRGRSLGDGTPSEQVVGGILGLPADVTPLCLIAIGHREATCEPHNEDDLRWENIHINQY